MNQAYDNFLESHPAAIALREHVLRYPEGCDSTFNTSFTNCGICASDHEEVLDAYFEAQREAGFSEFSWPIGWIGSMTSDLLRMCQYVGANAEYIPRAIEFCQHALADYFECTAREEGSEAYDAFVETE